MEGGEKGLTELETRHKDQLVVKQEGLPKAVRVSEIIEYPQIFQPRGSHFIDYHVKDLIRAIRDTGMLDPILVMRIGNEVVLLDGHHRKAAYEGYGVKTEVPVRWFSGTVREAVLMATAANSKAKLPLTNSEKQNRAWQLVIFRRYSKKQIARAAGIGEAQVGRMRAAMKTLEEHDLDLPDLWWEALKRSQTLKYEESDWPHSDWEFKRDKLVADWTQRMHKQFGPKLAQNPELAAQVLANYFGRRFDSLMEFGDRLRADPVEIIYETDDF